MRLRSDKIGCSVRFVGEAFPFRSYACSAPSDLKKPVEYSAVDMFVCVVQKKLFASDFAENSPDYYCYYCFGEENLSACAVAEEPSVAVCFAEPEVAASVQGYSEHSHSLKTAAAFLSHGAGRPVALIVFPREYSPFLSP